jgi:hypothetical protein
MYARLLDKGYYLKINIARGHYGRDDTCIINRGVGCVASNLLYKGMGSSDIQKLNL